MVKSRLLTAIIGTAIVTIGSYQLAQAYSNDAAPAATAPAPDAAAPSDAPVMTTQDVDPSKNMAQNVLDSPNFVTLSKALKATGLDAMLGGSGPLVLFAPTEAAFAKIPADQLADLMKEENKSKLSKILSYHVVPGNLSFSDLEKLGATGNAVPLRTSAGSGISVKKEGDKWTVIDENGAVANITVAGVKTTNGTLYVLDAVLMPKM